VKDRKETCQYYRVGLAFCKTALRTHAYFSSQLSLDQKLFPFVTITGLRVETMTMPSTG